MLVLSRKVGQSICLGDDIEIVVNAIHGNRIQLGFIAPNSVAIRRSELTPTIASSVLAGVADEIQMASSGEPRSA